jgi:para-aminobenzoate synthetase component 1
MPTDRARPASAVGASVRETDLLERWPLVAGRPLPFLLDSGALGRWSFLGADPAVVLVAKGGRGSVWRAGRESPLEGNPFDALESLLAEHAVAPLPDVPFPGGAVGAFGYDLARHLERLPCAAQDDLDFPDLVVGFYDQVEILDRQEGRSWTLRVPGAGGPRALDDDSARIAFAAPPRPSTPGRNFERPAYLAAVERVREHIRAGDVYQANLSQRFHARSRRSNPDLYRALRARSPAPFGAILEFGPRAVLSVSPERFLELRDGRVLTRPIKGTRPRGADPAADARLREELLESPKDDAELAMIVDLERNDLGRVCETGSVRVVAPKTLEVHSTVFHLSATIEGRLRAGLGPVDLLRAAFPGGSVTGAPKIRAMEIIDDLEPTRRAFYTGAIGMIGYDGSLNLSIAIRTLLREGEDVWFQAGGGIVADSDPEAEYEETLTKARALRAALAEEGIP